MEIKTCEQYVLAELDYEQRRNGRLEAENNRLAKRLDAMTKRAKSYKETIDRPKTPIEALADKVMREEMLVRFSYANVTGVRNSLTGQVLGFYEWCREAMRLCMGSSMSGIPRRRIYIRSCTGGSTAAGTIAPVWTSRPIS